jgi:hypothetical protein
MKIGIIGAGNIGAALTRHFSRLGHDVVVANSRGPETLSDLARETGAKPVPVSEVPRGRDLVVVTIPEGKIPDLPRELFKNAPANLVVIYGCRRHNRKANYVFADGHAGLYNANDIRCDEGECWWSLRLDAHARQMTAAFGGRGSGP